MTTTERNRATNLNAGYSPEDMPPAYVFPLSVQRAKREPREGYRTPDYAGTLPRRAQNGY